MLNESAGTVRAAVKSRVETGREMLVRYDHPILLLQHMVWHEGYHHGQIKLALKAMGRPLDDEEIGRVTWHVWFDKAGAGRCSEQYAERSTTGWITVDAAELAEMQESHDAVYRPESLRKACRRAVEGSNGRRLVLPSRDPAERVQEAARTGGFATRSGRRRAA